MSKPTLTVTSDFTSEFNNIISKFKNDVILVGIPASNTSRQDNEPIGNAALLALCNFGSPLQNIPAWPVMAIGIKNAQDAIAEQFKLAATNALTKGLSALDTYYNRAGIIASVSIKKVITAQTDKPEGRPLKLTLKRRKSKGSKYWLVTGQMRNAITYVINKGGF